MSWLNISVSNLIVIRDATGKIHSIPHGNVVEMIAGRTSIIQG